MGRILLPTLVAVTLLPVANGASADVRQPLAVPVLNAAWIEGHTGAASVPTSAAPPPTGSHRGLDNLRADEPPFLPGWPVDMGSGPNFPFGVALADVDGDGSIEVMAGSTNGKFWIWNHAGSPLPGWPLSFPGAVQTKPTVGDLDLDGDLEVLFSYRISASPVGIAAYHHDATPVAGWPRMASEGYGPVSVSLYDLDGDDRPEVLWGGYGGVFAWYADGTPLPWSPAAAEGRVAATLAIGNFIGDPAPEIVSITLDPDLDYHTWVNCHRSDGSVPPGWPIYIPDYTSWGAPSLGDIDGNGFRELLVTTHGSRTNVYVFDALGRVVPGFPATTTSTASSSSPTLADIDGDGDLEIFQTVNSIAANFQAWDHRGQPLPGWPAPAQWNMGCSPVVANFDLDEELEALAVDNLSPGFMYGHNPDGTYAAGFPFVADPGTSGPSSPSIADVDGDGGLDIALTMFAGVVGIWDLDVPWSPSRAGWPTCYHDNWNTNQFGFVPPDGTTGVEPSTDFSLDWSATVSPSPFSDSTVLRLLAPAGGAVRIQIYDSAGALVRDWGQRGAGRRETEVTWDGRDHRGHAVASGRYFVSWGRDRRAVTPVIVLR